MAKTSSIVGLTGKDFRRRVRAECGHTPDNARVRVMEALGVIAPIKNEIGWRIFTGKDVRTAVAWMRANPPRPRGRPRNTVRTAAP